MMYEYIFKIILFQIILSLLIIKTSYKLKLTDTPKDRKNHEKPVAYTGGVILSLTFLFVVFITEFDDNYLNLLLSYSILITFSGFIDDKYNVNPGTKILLQIVPIYLLINQGLFLIDIGTYEIIGKIYLGSFSKIFTLLCCLLMINSSNYSDGIDSLLALISFSIFISFGCYLIMMSKSETANFLFIISIPMLIHSIFNFELIKKFKVFLGDSGSNLIGFLISFTAIYMYRYQEIPPTLVIWPLAFLIFEFLTVNIIRFINDKAIFKPGSDHIHYEINKIYGVNNKTVLIILLILNLIFSLLGYIFYINLSNLMIIFLYFSSFLLYFYLRLYLNKKIKLLI